MIENILAATAVAVVAVLAFNVGRMADTNAPACKPVTFVEPKADEWPNTTPIDKSDPFWKFNNNLTVNGTPYKKEEVSPGKWQWVVDRQEQADRAAIESGRRNLFYALQSRVLTDDEMQQVTQFGTSLNIEPNVSFYPEQKQRELNEALLQQMRLRAAAATLGAKP